MCSASDEVDVPYPHYLCPVDDCELPLAEARLSVTCAEHQPRAEQVAFTVREATSADRHAIEEICDRAWGETEIDVLRLARSTCWPARTSSPRSTASWPA